MNIDAEIKEVTGVRMQVLLESTVGVVNKREGVIEYAREKERKAK